jgi:hypothetical protein
MPSPAADRLTSTAWLFEDVHWAGRDALSFIERAQATPASSGRLIVATARPDIFEAEPRWAVADGDAGRHSAGMHGLFGRLGIEPRRDPDPALLMPSFDQDVGLTSGLEAQDEVLRRWIADGRLDVVDEAVRRMRVAVGRTPTPLGRAGLALFESRLALALGDAAGAARSARAALAVAAEVHARWWRARAHRLLDRAGAATATELAEAAAIERELGRAHPAS